MEEKNGFTKQSMSLGNCHLTHVKGDDADLDGKSIVHPDHPLALVVVKGIKSPRIPEHMPATAVVCCSVAVVPG